LNILCFDKTGFTAALIARLRELFFSRSASMQPRQPTNL